MTAQRSDATMEVYSERELGAGVRRRILMSVVRDRTPRIHIEHTRDGRPAGGPFIHGDDAHIVLEASAAAKDPTVPDGIVDSIFLRSGARIEIGSYHGAVTFTTVLADGKRCRTTTICGEELRALDLALEHMSGAL